MTTAEWLAFGATLLAVLGSFASWVFSKLESLEAKIIARAETTFAKQQDFVRLETRFDSLENMTREIRDDVRILAHTKSHS